jgi:hypothetical protein
MKKLSFTQLDGWPASTETWKYFQEMIEQVQSLSLVGGNNYIVSGCIETGNNVSSGWVVLNGEILPFDGGLKQDKIVAIEMPAVKEFFGGALLPYYLDRKAIFGSGAGEVSWSDVRRNDPANSILTRLERLERISAPFLPVTASDGTVHRGGMLLWKKPAILIPAGWQEVTDWRGRLPLGYTPDDADFNEVGKTGGSKTHTLQVPNMPPHDHAMENMSRRGWPKQSGDRTNDDYFIDKSQDAAAYYKPLTMSKTGGSNGAAVGVNHMNPFRIVMFIEYLGN